MDCKIIIVTHNNEKHINWLLSGLESSESDLLIHIVDSGSSDKKYLEGIKTKHKILVELKDNIGFVKGNNSALNDIENYEWVLFLNPDAKIEGSDLDRLLEFSKGIGNKKIGVLTVPLQRYNISEMSPTGYIDSNGIKCNFYGRWEDIDSGVKVNITGGKKNHHEVDAVCGAFMLIKSDVLNKYRDKKGRVGFENTYFMYKEDIELSLRLKNKGMRNIIYNEISAYHCRGWNKKRNEVPYWAKLSSAKNDIDIAIRYKFRAIPYALIKFIWVFFLEKKNKT